MTRDPWADLMSGPDADLPEGGTVVRPSLRAFLVLFFQGTWQILLALLSLAPVVLFGNPSESREPELGIGGLIETVDRYAQLANFAPLAIAPFLPAIRLLFTRYIFDQEGIVVRTVLLARKDQRVPWRKVTSIIHRRGVVEWVMGIERVEVSAYGRKGTTLQLMGLRDGNKVKDVLARRMLRNASAAAVFEND